MAHEITATDNFGEVQLNGEKAWHGLGIAIPDGLSAVDGFKTIGLDWDTVSFPAFANLPGEPLFGHPARLVKAEDTFLHTRRDNGTCLGVVSGRYQPVSNMEMAEFADALVGVDAAVRLETAGSLNGGKRVFCTIVLPKTIEVVDGDIVKMYIIGSNGHDGLMSFNWYASGIRVVCANTLAMSEYSAAGLTRFLHKGGMTAQERLDKVRAALGIIVRDSEVFEKDVRSLAKKFLKKDQIEAYFEAIYVRKFGIADEDMNAEDLARRQKHHDTLIGKWWYYLQNEKNTIKGIEGSAWAVYNAFSEWSDHERGRYEENADGRVNSNLFGASALDKKRAFREALTLTA